MKSLVIALGASFWRMLGSLKSWKLPMIEKIVATTRALRMAGSLTETTVRHSPAPSIAAAS